MKMAHRNWHYLKGLGGVALLEEECHWGLGLKVSGAQARPRVAIFLLPADLETELSVASPASRLSACCHTLPFVMIMD